ncbi:proline-rich protein 36-like [Calypte anna]|uniref:proline-rich protein 36-like n=1 Tax=Calypte anna TaxID=9244 RepID=UPI0011C3E7C4|nr:proline-rich protein 36-like [Calypte anna]
MQLKIHFCVGRTRAWEPPADEVESWMLTNACTLPTPWEKISFERDNGWQRSTGESLWAALLYPLLNRTVVPPAAVAELLGGSAPPVTPTPPPRTTAAAAAGRPGARGGRGAAGRGRALTFRCGEAAASRPSPAPARARRWRWTGSRSRGRLRSSAERRREAGALRRAEVGRRSAENSSRQLPTRGACDLRRDGTRGALARFGDPLCGRRLLFYEAVRHRGNRGGVGGGSLWVCSLGALLPAGRPAKSARRGVCSNAARRDWSGGGRLPRSTRFPRRRQTRCFGRGAGPRLPRGCNPSVRFTPHARLSPMLVRARGCRRARRGGAALSSLARISPVSRASTFPATDPGSDPPGPEVSPLPPRHRGGEVPGEHPPAFSLPAADSGGPAEPPSLRPSRRGGARTQAPPRRGRRLARGGCGALASGGGPVPRISSPPWPRRRWSHRTATGGGCRGDAERNPAFWMPFGWGDASLVWIMCLLIFCNLRQQCVKCACYM